MFLVESSETIRKGWLRSWKVLFFFTLTNSVLCGLLVFFYRNCGTVWGDLIDGAFVGIIPPLVLYFCYRRCYAKPGGKFLAIALMLAGGGIPKNYNVCLLWGSSSGSALGLIYLLIMLVHAALFWWFAVNSISLIATNKKLRLLVKEKVLSGPQFKIDPVSK